MMMKSRTCVLSSLAVASLLLAGSTLAQQAMPASAPMSAPAGNSASYQTPQGQVTVDSAPAPAPAIGPAPSFEQLSGGGKSISEDQAAAYPPLANDFINADTNKNHSISKAEYERWLKQL
jgi:hypothetical protein